MKFNVSKTYNFYCIELIGKRRKLNRGNILVDTDGLFIGTINGEKFAVGVYVPNKGIILRTIDKNNVTEYLFIKNNNPQGIVYDISLGSKTIVGKCTFNIKENKLIDVDDISKKVRSISNDAFSFISKCMLQSTFDEHKAMSSEIEKIYLIKKNKKWS